MAYRFVRRILFAPLFDRWPAVARLRHWADTIALVRRIFLVRHGCHPRLFRPRSYSEKIQWRKLFDLDPMFAIFSDKLAVRDFIAARAGPGVLVPLLWAGEDPEQIPFDDLRPPYIIKSTHGSGHLIRVTDAAALDRAGAVATCREWLEKPFGLDLGEPGYEFVPRRIIVERLLQDANGQPPTEQRIFVFGGRAQLVQTTIAEHGHQINAGFHDRDWGWMRWVLTSPLLAEDLPRPARLDAMIALAETIAAGYGHLRIDLYDCEDGLRVGEITLYTWSGMFPFNPPEGDLILGAHWRIRAPMWRALTAIAFRRREIRPPQDRSWAQARH